MSNKPNLRILSWGRVVDLKEPQTCFICGKKDDKVTSVVNVAILDHRQPSRSYPVHCACYLKGGPEKVLALVQDQIDGEKKHPIISFTIYSKSLDDLSDMLYYLFSENSAVISHSVHFHAEIGYDVEEVRFHAHIRGIECQPELLQDYTDKITVIEQVYESDLTGEEQDHF